MTTTVARFAVVALLFIAGTVSANEAVFGPVTVAPGQNVLLAAFNADDSPAANEILVKFSIQDLEGNVFSFVGKVYAT